MQTVSTKYVGAFSDSSGYGDAARQDVAALHLAGVDVTTELAVHMKEKTAHGWPGELSYALQDRNIPYKVKMLHVTPDMYDNYIEKDKYHIGRLFWETDRLPRDWAKFCNQMGEIWASSSNMIELFKKSGVKVPMYYFPEPIDVTMGDKDYGKWVVPSHQGYLFYSMFQWIERKNPRALLRAYWRAFEGKQDVTLLIKTFRLSYTDEEKRRIRNDIILWKNEMGKGEWPRVLISLDLLDQEGVMKLHHTGDCFVIGHRGEGWGRPIQESLLMSKPVIATARGGIHEYLQPEHYFGIDSKYVPVTEVPYIKFYTTDQMWAEVDEKQLIKAMQFCYTNKELATSKGVVAKDFIKESFNYHRIGEDMKLRLKEIYRGLP